MKRPLPTECINQSVKVYGYTTKTSKRPMWFSIMQKGKVQGHAVSVVVENVTFEINAAGEAKSREGVRRADGSWVKKPNTKTPYAFVVGTLKSVATETVEQSLGVPIRFYPNNRKGGYFGNAQTGERITSALYVVLTPDSVVAYF